MEPEDQWKAYVFISMNCVNQTTCLIDEKIQNVKLSFSLLKFFSYSNSIWKSAQKWEFKYPFSFFLYIILNMLSVLILMAWILACAG